MKCKAKVNMPRHRSCCQACTKASLCEVWLIVGKAPSKPTATVTQIHVSHQNKANFGSWARISSAKTFPPEYFGCSPSSASRYTCSCLAASSGGSSLGVVWDVRPSPVLKLCYLAQRLLRWNPAILRTWEQNDTGRFQGQKGALCSHDPTNPIPAAAFCPTMHSSDTLSWKPGW